MIQDDKITSKPHWKWMTDGKIRYKTDAEYERHFLSLFKTAVERRTGREHPSWLNLAAA